MKQRRQFLFFLVLALILMGISLLSPVLEPHDPYQTNIMISKRMPSADYLLGTDSLGRCVFSRVLEGSKTSVFISLFLVGINFAIGTVLGITSGYFGGKYDFFVMRILDIMLSFPELVLAIAVAGIMGGGIMNAMFAMTLTGWTVYARLARSLTMGLKKEEYVLAAKLEGASSPRIMAVQIFPNIVLPLLANATVHIPSVMIEFAGLSFLGLGVQVPKAEWGSMISENMGLLQLMPWAVFAPCAAIVLTVLVFSLLGDSFQAMVSSDGVDQRER